MLDAPTSSPLTVTLDRPLTVGTLELGNFGAAATGYTLSGSGSNTLTLDNSGSAAMIVVDNGSHVIDAAVVLADNLVVSGSGTLTFGSASNIAGNGKSLTMSGAGGTLILSGSDSYSGGTSVTAGTLILASETACRRGQA